jgi:hypothetical protein
MRKSRYDAIMKVWGTSEDEPEVVAAVHDRIKYSEIHDDVPYPCVLNWISTDSEEQYEKNQRKSQDKLDLYGWDDTSVTYDLNSHGFRDKEFDCPDENSIITIGECFTFGTGLPREMTWPSLLEAEINTKIFNLSRPISGLDQAFRILYYWLPVLKSKTVLLFESSGLAREIFLGNESCSIGHWSLEDWRIDLVANRNERYISRQKNMLAIKAWCDMHDVTLHVVDTAARNRIGNSTYDKYKHEPKCVGRDLMHPGKHFHEAVMQEFKQIIGVSK